MITTVSSWVRKNKTEKKHQRDFFESPCHTSVMGVWSNTNSNTIET